MEWTGRRTDTTLFIIFQPLLEDGDNRLLLLSSCSQLCADYSSIAVWLNRAACVCHSFSILLLPLTWPKLKLWRDIVVLPQLPILIGITPDRTWPLPCCRLPNAPVPGTWNSGFCRGRHPTPTAPLQWPIITNSQAVSCSMFIIMVEKKPLLPPTPASSIVLLFQTPVLRCSVVYWWAPVVALIMLWVEMFFLLCVYVCTIGLDVCFRWMLCLCLWWDICMPRRVLPGFLTIIVL